MKGKRYVIRQATIDDIDCLAELLSELFSIEKSFTINKLKQKAGLSLLIDNKNSVVLVAEKNNRIIGMVTGQLVVSTAEGGFSVLLEDMSVSGKYRRKGVGSDLLETLASWGFRKGAKRIQLLADRTNDPAIAFYVDHDFSRSNMEGLYCALP
jgi:ribosomal protein S18 acetylase RimI-like enzyme